MMTKINLTLVLFLVTTPVFGGVVSLRTYYPSPLGNYRFLTLSPTAIPPECALEDDVGTLFYDSTVNRLRLCHQDALGNILLTDSLSVWTQSETDPYVYLTDETPGLNVGIGTQTPITLLHLYASDPGEAKKMLTVENNATGANTGAFIQLKSGSGVDDGGHIGGIYEGPAAGDGALSFWTSAASVGSERMRIDHNGFVGIGTTDPELKLTLDTDGGILSKGTFGSGESLVSEGEGTRMIWYPRKAAFRAGFVSDVNWNDANIGNFSSALGYNTSAYGDGASAMGINTIASGNGSFAVGNQAQATGEAAMALGTAAQATGVGSVSIGSGNASADAAIVLGSGSASGSGAVTIGAGVASNTESISIGRAHVTGYGSIAISGTLASFSPVSPTISGSNSYVIGNGNFDVQADNTILISANSPFPGIPTPVSTSNLIALNNTYVTVNTITPQAGFNFTVAGNAYKSIGGGLWNVVSDERLKDIDRPFEKGLKEIESLNPVYFHYKKDNPLNISSVNQNIGLIAQEVQKVIPEAVTPSGEYLTMNSEPVFWAMLNAIKELKKENEELKTRLEKLEAQK